VSDDGRSYTGSWRPNPGADETVNPPYDLTGTKIVEAGDAMTS
jgi:hypothetical protein